MIDRVAGCDLDHAAGLEIGDEPQACISVSVDRGALHLQGDSPAVGGCREGFYIGHLDEFGERDPAALARLGEARARGNEQQEGYASREPPPAPTGHHDLRTCSAMKRLRPDALIGS